MSSEITYTHPDVFGRGVAEGWAEPEADPTRIDWPARQARALLPFKVVDGRPVNPHASTGIRHGRNSMGRWGETACVDAVVTLTDTCGDRWLLLIERRGGDGTSGWALPGGGIDPGEGVLDAARRELWEETGLTVADGRSWAVLPPRYVPDPRASDEAWAVTVPCRVDLGQHLRGLFPAARGADDARRAEWVPAGSYDELSPHVRAEFGGEVFVAHVGLLRDLLDGDAW